MQLRENGDRAEGHSRAPRVRSALVALVVAVLLSATLASPASAVTVPPTVAQPTAIGGAGSWSAIRGQHVTTLAPYAHATVVGRGHHALFGELGAIVARSAIGSPVMDWDGLTTWGGGEFATLGYEHASRHVVLRASAGIAVGRGGAQPMVGFAIGARP